MPDAFICLQPTQGPSHNRCLGRRRDLQDATQKSAQFSALRMALGQIGKPQNGLPCQMEPRSQTCGPIPGGLILTHTRIWFLVSVVIAPSISCSSLQRACLLQAHCHGSKRGPEWSKIWTSSWHESHYRNELCKEVYRAEDLLSRAWQEHGALIGGSR